MIAVVLVGIAAAVVILVLGIAVCHQADKLLSEIDAARDARGEARRR